MHLSSSAFKGHIQTAHAYWTQLLKPGDCVIDATCGNGHDTLLLAQLVLTEQSGWLYGFDIQEKAISATRQRLDGELPPQMLSRVILYQSSHEQFSDAIKPESVNLIVYNLGYLPGGNKELTTYKESTLASLQKALLLLKPGGAVSITCYPGHPAGELEENEVLAFAAALPTKSYCCMHQRWVNRTRSPSLLWVQKQS